MDLEKKLAGTNQTKIDSKPIFFDLSKPADQKAFEKLFDEKKIQHVSDDYEEQCKELFAFENPAKVYTLDFPKLFSEHFAGLQKEKPLWQHGLWVYFPWLSKTVHILPDTDFQRLRTSRNRNLISAEEQRKFYTSMMVIGALSVGSSVAYALTLQAGAKNVTLADMDLLALSNTNRI